MGAVYLVYRHTVKKQQNKNSVRTERQSIIPTDDPWSAAGIPEFSGQQYQSVTSALKPDAA